MEAIDKLKSKRKLARASCTKLITKIDSTIESLKEDETGQENLSEYLVLLDEKQNELKILNEQIEDLIVESKAFETDIQLSLEYDESISNAKFNIRSNLKKFKVIVQPQSASANASNLNNSTSTSLQCSINLPKINIPTFNGDPSMFLEFINSFKSAIDSNASLSNVDKFIYLKSLLAGEAYKSVAGFALTEENYTSCLELLNDRYGKQEHLISCFVNKLLELEPVKFSSNIKALRFLFDESEVSIRNLKCMGVASSNFGHLLIPIILKQLPPNLVVEFHRKKNPKKSGDIDELMKFIKFEIESREAANAVSGLSLKTHEVSRSKGQYQQNRNKTNIPTSATLNTVVKNVCIFCNSNWHTGLKCKVLTDEQKRFKLRKDGRCYRCMNNKNHLISQCKVKIPPCDMCQSFQHNYLFCPKMKNRIESQNQNTEKAEVTQIPENQAVISSVLESNSNKSYTTLLQTASVQVEYGPKKFITRLLFDSGSQKTFIRKDLANALKLKPLKKEKLLIYTFSKRNPSEVEFDLVNITLRSRFPPYSSINIPALVTDEISGADIHSNINPQVVRNILLKECEVADSLISSRPVQILLGADFMFSTFMGELQKINKQLYLQPTIFGQTLVGQMPHYLQNSTSCFKVVCSSPETDLKCLWQVESFLVNDPVEHKTDTLLTFEKNLRYVDNRYQAPLIWKSESARKNLCDNLEVAKRRFIALEKRFNADESLFERYNAVMKEQLREGIIEVCSDSCVTGYVMPHREVFRENSSSTKTRVVYDASSKQGTNTSLNECLSSGENLNANLVDVILKFREHKIGFCGDIARAFLQIQVSDVDKNYLCFLYYKNCEKTQPVTMYHFNRHCFGVTCSPYVLAATIKAHIKKYEITHPLAYEMLSKSLYVDDLFFGSSTAQEAFELSADAVSILKAANMTMRKFDTNSKDLRKLWENSNLIELNEHTNESHLKVLGLNWNNKEDTLGLDLRSLLSDLNDKECTKRNVLHTAAKIFDPSGFVAPFLIRIKCLLQELWQLGLEWDEVFSGEIKEKWQLWCNEIKELQNLKIPRYYFSDTIAEELQLHVFSDASLRAFGAVAYFRYRTSPDTFNTRFVIAKTRVAPLKKLTLPRLELMGATIAARIVNHLKKIFKNLETIILWSDSTIALYWIRGSASKWKPFVSNRVSEIQEITDPNMWRHCISKDNSADLLTREMTSKDLITSEKWWHGPEWLKHPENTWPETKGFESDSIDIDTESKTKVAVNSTLIQDKFIDPDRFSCVKKLLRVTAWVLRFINALKRKVNQKGTLTSDELNRAEQLWVKVVQNEFYSKEIDCLKNKKPLPKDSKLLSLHPFLDHENVLRVSGRLQKTHLSMNEKHPIILPPKCKLTELLIWESHERVFHSSVSHTLVQLREKYWITKARPAVKSLLRKCITCKRFNSSPGDQTVAPLPVDRVEESAPFSVIGVDFAGPLFVKNNDTKQYILLITCAVTRNIHLELVGDLTTDTFLLAFRRFVARRGLCSVVFSDNARTFKRAELELKQLWTVISHPDVKRYYASNNIEWKYIVERAAWWGGFYERMVRTVKVALRKTLGKSSLTIDQLQTLLTEIEGMVNSRPITYVGSEAEEPEALTPAHFLLGKRISSLPSVRLHFDSNISSRKCLINAFNYREKLMRSFWSRWKNEYLLNLRSAHLSSIKSNIPEFKINDIVLIKDDHLPRNFWKLGRILELFPGRDGKVRACKIKTESSIIKRPLQLLYNLEIQN